MKTNGDKSDEQLLVEKILRTLTAKFKYIVAEIEESKDLTAMTVDELQGILQAHEQRMNERSGEKKLIEQAFQSQVSIKSQNSKYEQDEYSSHGRGRGHGSYTHASTRWTLQSLWRWRVS